MFYQCLKEPGFVINPQVGKSCAKTVVGPVYARLLVSYHTISLYLQLLTIHSTLPTCFIASQYSQYSNNGRLPSFTFVSTYFQPSGRSPVYLGLFHILLYTQELFYYIPHITVEYLITESV